MTGVSEVTAHHHLDLLDCLADAVAAHSTQVELYAISQELALTRFSGGRVHQNVVDTGLRVFARAWSGNGAGFAIASSLDGGTLSEIIERAIVHSAEVEGPTIELPDSVELSNDPYIDSTAAFGAEARARLVEKIQEAAGETAVPHGNIRVAVQSHALVNSAGLRASYASTYAALNLVAQAEGRSTGYSGAIGRDIDQIDFMGSGSRAVRMAEEGRHPVVVDPGRYEVLIDPPAVSMLLVSLGYVGLNAFSASAARSSSAWHKPTRVVGSNAFSLIDDPLDDAALYSPIDAEGTPRSPLPLVTNGEVVGVAHDLTTAAQDGTTTTGHALPAGDKSPSPHSLAIPPGSIRRDEIIAGMKQGLIVNRIHPFVTLRGGPDGELSGTTRDGVFLVENGEVIAPVGNVRWSNAMSDLFGSVEAVSSERSVEFMDLPEFSPHTNHVPSLYSTHFTVQASQPRER